MSFGTMLCSTLVRDDPAVPTAMSAYLVGYRPMRGFGPSGHSMGGYGMGVVVAAVGTTLDDDSNETADATGVDMARFPFHFKDNRPTGIDASADIDTLRTLLATAYAKDSSMLLRDIMVFGKLPDDGKNKHSVYMVALTWLWGMHPGTFMLSVAHDIGYNDMLTLLSVVTFNRSFSVERLWLGYKSGASREMLRASLYAKEKTIWKNLLARFCVTSKDVVLAEAPRRSARMRSNMRTPATLRREETATGFISSFVSTPDTPQTPKTPKTAADNTSAYAFGSMDVTCKQYRAAVRASDDTKRRKKNIWLNEEFKTQWQAERAKLHRHDYGARVGVPGTEEDYRALVEFVVCSFAKGVATKDPMAVKWAPIPGCVHDNCTKGALLCNRADEGGAATWGSSCGISHAIAYRLCGHLLDTRVAVDAQKNILVSLYRGALEEAAARA